MLPEYFQDRISSVKIIETSSSQSKNSKAENNKNDEKRQSIIDANEMRRDMREIIREMREMRDSK